MKSFLFPSHDPGAVSGTASGAIPLAGGIYGNGSSISTSGATLIDCGVISGLNVETGNFSLFTWAKTDAAHNGVLWTNTNAGAISGTSLRSFSNGNMWFHQVNYNLAASVAVAVNYYNNEWNMIGYTKNGSQIDAYFNGSIIGSGFNATSISGAKNFTLSQIEFAGIGWDGEIDEFHF